MRIQIFFVESCLFGVVVILSLLFLLKVFRWRVWGMCVVLFFLTFRLILKVQVHINFTLKLPNRYKVFIDLSVEVFLQVSPLVVQEGDFQRSSSTHRSFNTTIRDHKSGRIKWESNLKTTFPFISKRDG